MRRIRTVAVFPTMFTLANLVLGFFAIAVASRVEAPTEVSDATPSAERILLSDVIHVPRLNQADPTHNILLCSWLIFLAMVCDMLDGGVARLTRNTSDFGGQLDSLADVVSFGVAPSILMVKMCPGVSFEYRQAIWLIAATFTACAAMRLARFNVENEENDDHMWFSGLPTPAAAAALAGFAMLFYSLRKETQLLHTEHVDLIIQYLLPILSVALSLLMVSRIPFPHVVSQLLRGNRGLGHVVGLVFALVPILVFPTYVVPVLASLFAIVPPLHYAWRRFRLWRVGAAAS